MVATGGIPVASKRAASEWTSGKLEGLLTQGVADARGLGGSGIAHAMASRPPLYCRGPQRSTRRTAPGVPGSSAGLW